MRVRCARVCLFVLAQSCSTSMHGSNEKCKPGCCRQLTTAAATIPDHRPMDHARQRIATAPDNARSAIRTICRHDAVPFTPAGLPKDGAQPHERNGETARLPPALARLDQIE